MTLMKRLLIFCFAVSAVLVHSQSLPPLSDVQASWIDSFSSNSFSVDSFYIPDRSALFMEEKLITGTDNIINELRLVKDKIGAIESSEVLEYYSHREGQQFEIGTLNGEWYYVIGWRFLDGWKKELEILYPAEILDQQDIPGITASRKLWVTLSNSHSPEKLAREICLPEGYYFNSGETYVGMEIAEAYAYMSGESWKIELETLKTIQIQPEIAIDIGRFYSSGTGLYVLVWKKAGDRWQVALDFNF